MVGSAAGRSERVGWVGAATAQRAVLGIVERSEAHQRRWVSQGMLILGLPAPRCRNTQLPSVTYRADFERRLGEPGHEPLKMHDPLSGQLFMQLGDLLGFGDKRIGRLFRVRHLKLKGLDG